ncbi:hypothetical protein [Streptomyces sp. NPDC059278]|uniref:hypothetical protein n=1 Tax=Streptomyces sp. NPDC059278 TaxID=3346801 RepID=UPI0036B6683D
MTPYPPVASSVLMSVGTVTILSAFAALAIFRINYWTCLFFVFAGSVALALALVLGGGDLRGLFIPAAGLAAYLLGLLGGKRQPGPGTPGRIDNP